MKCLVHCSSPDSIDCRQHHNINLTLSPKKFIGIEEDHQTTIEGGVEVDLPEGDRLKNTHLLQKNLLKSYTHFFFSLLYSNVLMVELLAQSKRNHLKSVTSVP